jgi:serine phosphatase RsbU (regulator of sigma subunit)
VVRAHRARPASEIVQALYRAVRDFSPNAPQNDDVTAIVIKVI